MKLDEIQDIEILRNELKTMMCKCIENYTRGDNEFIKGEYYYVHQESDDELYIHDSGINGASIWISYEEAEEYFSLN